MSKIGIMKQDFFSKDEVAELIKSARFEKGKYELDVSDSGEIKISLIKKRWIQREDINS
jgi:hypothetical protein